MYKALNLFRDNIQQAKELSSLYEFLDNSANSLFEDLLRAEIVYSVSAFDKLIHDIVRMGMVEIFTRRRNPTPKYLSESFSLEVYNELISATVPPKEYIFEQAVIKKLSIVSYQTPEKVAEGLKSMWRSDC